MSQSCILHMCRYGILICRGVSAHVNMHVFAPESVQAYNNNNYLHFAFVIQDESTKHMTWSEEEKKYLRHFKGQPRLEGESETKFWERCASAMNVKDPDKKRTGKYTMIFFH